MKIKVERRTIEIPMCDEIEDVYDIYWGFTGIPSTWPFHTKWILDKASLSREDALKYIGHITLDSTPEAIIKC